VRCAGWGSVSQTADGQLSARAMIASPRDAALQKRGEQIRGDGIKGKALSVETQMQRKGEARAPQKTKGFERTRSTHL